MIEAKVEIANLDEIRAQFAAAPGIIEDELQQASASELAAMAQQLAVYPARRAGQRYVRTGDLGRGWTRRKPVFRVGNGGTRAVLSNPVRYAPYVQTDALQPWFHRARWINTVEQVAQANEAENQRALERAANNAAKRIG